jgi:methylated-DNA-[protein]-cysteine S-methyltransferase
MIFAYISLDVPCGQVVLAGDNVGVCFLTLTDPGGENAALAQVRKMFPDAEWVAGAGPLQAAVEELEEYFAGQRRAFTVPLAPVGTKFQQAVWTALRAIPYGQVRTYAELADEVGQPTAARAVGGACGSNPIALFIPCHRVIRADGTLGGFGCGMERKRWLLEHEGYVMRDP